MSVGLVGKGAGERRSTGLAMKAIGAVFCPETGVKAVRGFVGFAVCKLFEADQMVVGFVGKWACRQKWPLWVVVR